MDGRRNHSVSLDHRQWRAALSASRTPWRPALDIALPTLCISCREPVHGEGVCAAYWSKLSFMAKPYCPRLGIPLVCDPGPELLSMEAIADPPAYNRARAAVRYGDFARTLVHALKYQDRADLAPVMGDWMARAGEELLADADMLIPVPLRWRGFGRRYNQCGLLAGAIARQIRVAPAGMVPRRVRATEQQVGLRAHSARAMCRAHFWYLLAVRGTSRDGASCWSMTS